MKTTDLFKKADSKVINETIEKVFGQKLNLEGYTLDQLQDSRNRLRTQVYQYKQSSSFNETVDNEAFTKAQWMLDAINAEIAEREEFTVDPGLAEVEEGFGSMEEKVADLLKKFDADMNEVGGYGDPDMKEIIQHLKNGDAESAAEVVWYAYTDQDGGEFPEKEPYIDDLQAEFEELADGDFDKDPDEGGETDDGYALASAGFGSDEDYESIQGDEMNTQVKESATDRASAVVTAKSMVDRVGRWIEDLAQMENDQLLELGDVIRDEMGQEQAKAFVSQVAPAIQQALETLKGTREALSTGVRALSGDEQPMDMLGDEPAADDMSADVDAAAAPDELNAADEGEADFGAEDDFAAAEPASGGPDEAGRAKRESIQRSNNLLKVLAG